MIPAWVAPYTELRWHPTRMTCWTLVYRVLTEQFKLDVPLHDDVNVLTDVQEIANRLALAGAAWPAVSPAEARAGDVACFRMFRVPQHVGVVVDPPRFLHVEIDTDATIGSWTETRWRHRLIGIYRHPELAAWT